MLLSEIGISKVLVILVTSNKEENSNSIPVSEIFAELPSMLIVVKM